MRIAVIGAGIAGLGAAWLLGRRHEVTIFEVADRLGGHVNTVHVRVGDLDIAVDAGFIVYNQRNYPHLTRLFAELGVATDPSEMSFSVSIDDGRIEYAGKARGLLAQPANLLRRDFWQMLADISRFNRQAADLLTIPAVGSGPTIGDFLRRGNYSAAFAGHYLLPMAAAIWSSTLDDIAAYPARSFIQFLSNHGLLQLTRRPRWRTVSGGSRAYVDRLAGAFRGRVRLGCPVLGVERSDNGVKVVVANGERHGCDQVVFATHADQTLRMLGAAATAAERRILGCFRYQANRAVLHTDARLMPRRRAAWTSWNYMARSNLSAAQRVSVTYWMNRLQNLATSTPVFVTLNPLFEPAAASTLREFVYDHPQFDFATLTAQRQLPALQGIRRSWFCGSYCGHGFHEDALESGLRVALALGAPPPWAVDAGASAAMPPFVGSFEPAAAE